MKDLMKTIAWVVGTILFLGGIAYYYMGEKADCEASGGFYARGLLTMQCVELKK